MIGGHPVFLRFRSSFWACPLPPFCSFTRVS